MKTAKLNFSTSVGIPELENVPEFYHWLRKELEAYGFEFEEGILEGWSDLQALSVGTLTKKLEFPFFIFTQSES